MEELKKVYDTIEYLRTNGHDVPQSLLTQASELEMQYLTDEVAPVLHQKLVELLAPVRSNISLICTNYAGQPISIHISRETGLISILDDAVELKNNYANSTEDLDTDVDIEDDETANEPEGDFGIDGRKKAKTIGFTVRFDDGFFANGTTAKDTMIEALRHMGFERVTNFRAKTFMGYGLVDRRLRTDDNKPWQTKVDDWYVYTNMGNDTKKEMIRQVATFLGYNVAISDKINGIETPSLFPAKPKGKRAVFSLNGKAPLDKRNSVHAVVRLFVRNRPNATFNEIQRAFPGNLQGSYGVVMSMDEIAERRQRGLQVDNRYFLDPADLFTSADGVQFAVCNQWGDQFVNFQNYIKRFGWELKEV